MYAGVHDEHGRRAQGEAQRREKERETRRKRAGIKGEVGGQTKKDEVR